MRRDRETALVAHRLKCARRLIRFGLRKINVPADYVSYVNQAVLSAQAEVKFADTSANIERVIRLDAERSFYLMDIPTEYHDRLFTLIARVVRCLATSRHCS